MSRIKVMTFNLRIRNAGDGANYFDNRREKILSVINAEKPDLIGFQEADDFMQDFLLDCLNDYVIVGHGRNENYDGEGTPLAFRKDKFRLHAFREEWLSLTPDRPKSRVLGLDQSGCPRVVAFAELICRENGKRILFVNLHADHKGRITKLVEVGQIFDRISAAKCPFVMTGDFNTFPDSDTYRLIMGTESTFGTTDITANLNGTAHGFATGDPTNNKIDYIFTNLSPDPEASYIIPDDDACGCYYSDHNAVCGFVNIAENSTEEKTNG